MHQGSNGISLVVQTLMSNSIPINYTSNINQRRVNKKIPATQVTTSEK